MQKRSQLWQLFAAFFRIGLFTFGGGLAMLPMIEQEVIERHGWTDRGRDSGYLRYGPVGARG